MASEFNEISVTERPDLAGDPPRLTPRAGDPGHRLLAVRQHPNSVTASFETPSGEIIRARGDVLIGCDGIHSALRSLLHPEDGGIRWSGIRMWRGAVDWPAWRGGEAMLVAGHVNFCLGKN